MQVGPDVAQWLRRCATSRAVPGSIPGGVTGFFSDIFPSERTMALGSTQPLVPGIFPGGKGSRCVRLTTSPLSCAECHEIWEPKPPGTLWATPGLLRDSFTFIRMQVEIFRNVVKKKQLPYLNILICSISKESCSMRSIIFLPLAWCQPVIRFTPYMTCLV